MEILKIFGEVVETHLAICCIQVFEEGFGGDLCVSKLVLLALFDIYAWHSFEKHLFKDCFGFAVGLACCSGCSIDSVVLCFL